MALLTAMGSVSPVLAASTAKISPSFIAKANMTCTKINAAFSRTGETKFPYPTFDPLKPQQSLLKKVGKYFDQGLEVERSIPERLRKLGEPAKGVRTWNKLRTLADRLEKDAMRQARTATTGDAKAFVAAVRQYTRIDDPLEAMAKRAGFPRSSSCATVFG
ncbi:MAG: hypothetical protein ACRDV8_12305 [Acidimicrobiales bacterium]